MTMLATASVYVTDTGVAYVSHGGAFLAHLAEEGVNIVASIPYDVYFASVFASFGL